MIWRITTKVVYQDTREEQISLLVSSGYGLEPGNELHQAKKA